MARAYKERDAKQKTCMMCGEAFMSAAPNVLNCPDCRRAAKGKKEKSRYVISKLLREHRKNNMSEIAKVEAAARESGGSYGKATAPAVTVTIPANLRSCR